MSSKCRPVVGSSNRNSVPLRRACRLALALCAASARKPASFRRCASPPDSVGTGWPSFTYSRPTSTIGCSTRITSRSSRNSCTASLTVRSSTSATESSRITSPGRRRSIFTSRISARIAPAVAVGAAQVDVGEELHLDVLEARAAAGRAAAVAGVEAEHAGAVAALQRQRRVRRRACGSRRTRRRSSPGWSARSCRSGTGRRTPRRPASRRRAARRARPASRSPCRSGAAAPGTARPASACSCPSPRRR